MRLDTLFQDTIIFVDTVKVNAVNMTGELVKSGSSEFDAVKTFFTALIGALITQGLIMFVSWYKTKKDITAKKKLILTDLKTQREIVVKLKTAYQDLVNKFDNRTADTHSYGSFEDLHLEIYNSVLKTDLHTIFKEQITDVVNIYLTIGFLKKYSVDRIYTDYITKLDNHLREKKDNPTHDYYCPTHLDFIKIARGQLVNNMNTIDELLIEMDKINK